METIRRTPSVDGEQVLVAGDRQKASAASRTITGIPLNADEARSLVDEARRLGLSRILSDNEALQKEVA
jgi:LDH2 family malate/lactate/ureidoglycolate dehydrogenase